MRPSQIMIFAALLACQACQSAGVTSSANPQFYRQPAYIPDSLQSVVVDAQGVRWQVLEKRVYTQVGDSVDLWVRRSEPGGTDFGEPAFSGLAPSCYGRARWVVDQKSGAKVSACYLRRFTVMDGEVLFQLRLGGDWVTAMSVPVAEIFSDRDSDGWNDALEHLFGSQPDSPDSDGDGLADAQDANPLVADDLAVPEAPAETSADFEPSLVEKALQVSKACQKGKPLFISGPDQLKRAYQGLPCILLWRPLNASNTASLTARSGAQDNEQINSRGDKLSVDLAAREGGIGRVLVSVDRRQAEAPVVRLSHLLGTENVSFVHGDKGWVIDQRSFRLRSETPEE